MSTLRPRATWMRILALLVPLLLPALRAEAQTQPSFVRKWGGLTGPTGITVDIDEPTKPGQTTGTAGNVYVCDTGAHRVVKYSGTGVIITQWGTLGSALGQFNAPKGLRVTRGGLVFVADTGNNRIQRFTSTGTFPFQIGSGPGSGDGQLNGPEGVTIDAGGSVYVADTGNNRIEKFTSGGAFLLKWGTLGAGVGQFNAPKGVAVDRFGNVFVADTGNNRVQVFNPTGSPITTFGSSGAAPGFFSGPCGITVDIDEPTKPGQPTTAVIRDGVAGGNVYVADTGNHRIQKFTSNGTFITSWGTFGTLDGQFNAPQDVAVNSTREVYVADTGNNRVQEFTFEVAGIPVVTPWTLTILLLSLATAGAWWFGRRVRPAPAPVRRDA